MLTQIVVLNELNENFAHIYILYALIIC